MNIHVDLHVYVRDRQLGLRAEAGTHRLAAAMPLRRRHRNDARSQTALARRRAGELALGRG